MNHIFSKFQRNNLSLKGKNGKIPNPFDGTHTVTNDNNRKARIELDDSGMPLIKLLPDVKVQEKENKTMIQISIDKNGNEKEELLLKKVLKRNNIKSDTHQITLSKDIYEFKPVIQMQTELDIRDFKIGLLKIAYEFAVDQLPSYFEDLKAIEISEVLYKASYEEVEKFTAGTGFEKDMIEPFKDFFDFESKKHYLILLGGETGLFCVMYDCLNHLRHLFIYQIRAM